MKIEIERSKEELYIFVSGIWTTWTTVYRVYTHIGTSLFTDTIARISSSRITSHILHICIFVYLLACHWFYIIHLNSLKSNFQDTQLELRHHHGVSHQLMADIFFTLSDFEYQQKQYGNIRTSLCGGGGQDTRTDSTADKSVYPILSLRRNGIWTKNHTKDITVQTTGRSTFSL